MKTTAIGDAITSVVAGMTSAVTYQVFDGPPSKRPQRGVSQYLVIGAETLDDSGNPVSGAAMTQQFSGLGQIARDEHFDIPCVAVGIATANSISTARASALSIIQDVGTYLAGNKHPTNEIYNMLVSAVTGTQVLNTTGGAMIHVQFVISGEANLI